MRTIKHRNLYIILFVSAAFLMLFAFPRYALAQDCFDNSDCQSGFVCSFSDPTDPTTGSCVEVGSGDTGFFGPIVPLGCRGGGLNIIENCKGPQLLEMTANIIRFMINVAFVITVVMVLASGILLMVSGGSEDRVKRGRQALTAAIIGLVIVLVSWIAVNTIITIFTTCSGEWWKLQPLVCG